MKKIVIIGGGAAGPKTAAKAKRMNPENTVELYTDENLISYSACGLPYFIEGTVKNINQLIIRTPEDFEKQGINIFLEHKVEKIIPEKKCIIANNKEISYDTFIDSKESTNDRIKRQTLELYEQLPQDYDERIKRTDIRDKVVELNYTFFGYVASRTFINNSMATYEDKLQSCICGFLQIWWKFKYAAKYRTDLSFSVFFKPRLSEMIERELNEVKYSVRRTLCMEVGDQVGKHWAQVKYDDLSDPRVNLPPDKMSSLKAIFGTLYMADLETVELFTDI